MKWLEEQGGKEEAPVCRGRRAPDGEGRVLLAEGDGRQKNPWKGRCDMSARVQAREDVEGCGLDWTEPWGDMVHLECPLDMCGSSKLGD